MNRPQVTLRDLFWLVLVVALGCGWLVERRQLARRNKDLEKQYLTLREWHIKQVNKDVERLVREALSGQQSK